MADRRLRNFILPVAYTLKTAIAMRREFEVPRMEEILEHDRKLLFALKQSMGFVPNVYAMMTRSETALRRFMDFTHRPTVFDRLQTVTICLVAAQVNGSPYGLAAHTALAAEAGLSGSQIEAIRKGKVGWDEKLDTLAKFACELTARRGKVSPEMTARFYQAGYTDACLVDLVMLVGMETITDCLCNATWIPVDFPDAPVIIGECDGNG